jgi:hypothetical protein
MRVLLAALLTAPAWALPPCGDTPIYQPCDIEFDVPGASFQTVLWAEARSPEFKTYKLPAFWAGGSKMVARVAPTEAGVWTYRLSGNVAALEGKEGKFTAAARDIDGFIHRANVHHWRYTHSKKAHLWMGDTMYTLAWVDDAFFDAWLEARSKQKFTHVRLYAGPVDRFLMILWKPEGPPPEAFYSKLDARLQRMNERGIIADLILAGDGDSLVKAFPTMAERERFLRYIVGRYSAFNVTWQLMQEYEEYSDPRGITKEVGLKLKELDPYGHPRTTHTLNTSSPLLGDGWMDHILYQSSDDALGAIEHQELTAPQVNAEFAYENSGAGATHAHHVAPDVFRKRLWNATMNGQYVTYGNTGTYGGRNLPANAKHLEAPGTKAMTAWFELMSRTRWWDLQPYFDLDGGRALAHPDVEYVVYIEKPGPVEITVQKHSYNVYWIDPATGATTKEKKEWKGEVYKASPPDSTHDWILHLSRDGRKEGMAKSYFFESWRVPVQEPEVSKVKAPYELVSPPLEQVLEVGKPVPFEIKLKKETPGTRRMMYLIKGEIARDGQGVRVLGSGAKGNLLIPSHLLKEGEAPIAVRVAALNAPGKLYFVDYVLTAKRTGQAAR